MTRPLDLVEGDLTIPLPRPFDGLPPPFGSRRSAMRKAGQHAVRQTKTSTPAGPFPPDVKYVLFYEAPPQRADPHQFDALMTEAKHYLAMDTARPRSSRSDHLLAATIFAGCTIALAWLLVTYSMKDAEKAKPVAVAPAVLAAANPRVDPPELVAKAIVADTPRVAKAVPVAPLGPQQVAQVVPLSAAETKQVAQVASVPYAAPKPVAQTASPSFAVPKPTVRVIAGGNATLTQPENAGNRVKVARLSETHGTKRVALSRTTQPETRPTPSTQSEWAASAPRSHDDASSDEAQWMNWAAQQHRQSPTRRAAVPVAGDSNWNDHMTQRRITDDPGAFDTDHSGQ